MDQGSHCGWCSQDRCKNFLTKTDGNGTILTDRHPVCEYDKQNLIIAGEACLNSCTEGLRQEIYTKIEEKDRNGLKVLVLFGQAPVQALPQEG